MTEHKNPFVNVLESLNSHALPELSGRVAECVQRTRETGKMSSLTFTLKFKPKGQAQIEVVDDIKQNLPEFERASTLMFASDEGLLTKDNPNQTRLKLTDVNTQPNHFKEV